MVQSHWPCLTWKFFIIWFHKILKFNFRSLCYIILLSEMKLVSFSLWKFAKFFMSFLETQVNFPFLAQTISSNILWSKAAYWDIMFETFKCSDRNSSNSSFQFCNDEIIPLKSYTSFFIVMTRNSVNFKLIHFLLWIKGSHQSPNFETFEFSGESLEN